MFKRYHLDTLPYPISPNDVHFYENQLQININVFSYFDDENRARYPLVISRKNYKLVANLFYCKEHYSSIASISHFFQTLQNTITCIIFVYDASAILCHQRLCRDTSSYVRAMISCLCCMCFLYQE